VSSNPGIAALTLPFRRRIAKNTAPKSQPPNPGREIFRHRVEETTGKNVSTAKKIARDDKKVPEIRAKSDSIERQFPLQYQLLSRWLGARIRTQKWRSQSAFACRQDVRVQCLTKGFPPSAPTYEEIAQTH
jgi:hypothetical protein